MTMTNWSPSPFNDRQLFERWSRITHIPVSKLRQQDIEFWNIITTETEQLQTVLRKLHEKDNPLRFILLWDMSAHIFETRSQRDWDGLYDLKLPELLWEIALDPKTYEFDKSEFLEAKVRISTIPNSRHCTTY